MKCYSLNGEEFSYTELEDVLGDLEAEDRLVVGTIYYEAESEPVELVEFMRADRILDRASEEFYEDIGIEDNPFDNLSAAAVAELDALLKQWVSKHCNCTGTYWRIEGVEREVAVTAEDIAEFQSHYGTEDKP